MMIDKELIFESTNLSYEHFNSLFNDILLSEIIPYKHDYVNNTEELKGITFYGKRISLTEYNELSTTLKNKRLKLLISHNTITKRFRDFSFPNFSDKDKLLDIDKQCYSLISDIDTKKLLKYIYSYDEGRELLNKTFENWLSNYNIDILWNDYFDIVMKFQNAENSKHEISRDIDNLLYYKLSNKLTEEEKINERFKDYPIISLNLK